MFVFILDISVLMYISDVKNIEKYYKNIKNAHIQSIIMYTFVSV